MGDEVVRAGVAEVHGRRRRDRGVDDAAEPPLDLGPRLVPAHLDVPPSRLTSGVRRRSGSSCSCLSVDPFGQMKPWENTSSRSPRMRVTRSRPSPSARPSARGRSRPRTAGRSGRAYACRAIGDILRPCARVAPLRNRRRRPSTPTSCGGCTPAPRRGRRPPVGGRVHDRQPRRVDRGRGALGRPRQRQRPRRVPHAARRRRRDPRRRRRRSRAEGYGPPAKPGQRIGVVTASGRRRRRRAAVHQRRRVPGRRPRTARRRPWTPIRAGIGRVDLPAALGRLGDVVDAPTFVQAEGGAHLNGVAARRRLRRRAQPHRVAVARRRRRAAADVVAPRPTAGRLRPRPPARRRRGLPVQPLDAPDVRLVGSPRLAAS